MSKGLGTFIDFCEWVVRYINKQDNKEIDLDYFINENKEVEINGNFTSVIAKELKALEIIIDKQVEIFQVYINNNLIDYNENASGYYLTQEEFELLKEVLCDEEICLF